ncbi:MULTISPECIES: 30S ribosomal protein S12 methylthiotransferase accessory factor YcaO [unclassified Anaerobiospirillum]|uniref:30S ribosomal protein S12 methylthiotransferase accessory factor YcaO n=1 Tax=unclassified Anaerobiospirillum TaxID=2647410 RepID=UPI001FF14614|nr:MULTISPECIES: 30S ribosomal protein S12 methylthiotransferase accessory factor YcaO [unclassified Anaerobiospirillum]MCK0525746.1 30S ribosomal protein S12 methylthiotransferase accessory factor YcaO [Anaerobiospirillum sp. NML120449]MCK0535679.1 30S ribosomal protein S12 methylthiotransferase accessory factor YcaO [Anaerobiospirillum sp. NML120511]MCK0540863.1 30S ribosomal protein S12 methylthiotransferase accessory factor YcaO [Anaerobiospirillum sp. NML02-A-032]
MTTIAGKDAALEDTLSRFKKVASELKIDLVEEQWLNPLPDLWSVHLAVANCPAIFSNGKGSTRDAALCSAYGEIFERLATHMSFSDFYLGQENAEARFVHFPDEKWTPVSEDDEKSNAIPNDVLNVKLRELYGNNGSLTLENLVDIQSCSFERGVCSIPFTNARNGEIVYFPVNLLDNLYASNGMSAGNTEYEALVQGLSEVIERYVKARIIREGLCLPEVPEKIIEKYPRSWANFKALQSDELKCIVYDASLGGQYPVVCVVLFNQSNGTCVASFGSHPIFEVALDRTITELMQGRTFSDLDGFDEPSFDLEQTSGIINIESHFVDSTGLLPMMMFKKQPMFKFVAWDFDGSTHDQYKALRYIIDKLGFDIYIRTYQNLGVPVYRIIVPGMSEIYPFDDLIYNNTNAYIIFQEAILGLPGSDEDPQTYKDYLDELENENIDDDALVPKILGLLPDRDSPWSTLRFGELKCLIALEANDYERALDFARWTVMFNHTVFDLPRLRFYQCLTRVLECRLDSSLNFDDYAEALERIYSSATYSDVMAHINHEKKFNGLCASDLDMKNFKLHQEMIKVYKKVRQAQIALG